MRALQTRHWSREEYDRLVEQGILSTIDRVELIEGEIVSVSPQDVPHALGVSLADIALREAFGPRHYIRLALPIVASEDSEPEPDLAVLRGHPRDYAGMSTHPTSALLIVEIANSSLATDRRRKARVYARAGFPEYWIVNLHGRVVEVHRDPQGPGADADEPHYLTVSIYREGDIIIPLHAPQGRIAVTDLMP